MLQRNGERRRRNRGTWSLEEKTAVRESGGDDMPQVLSQPSESISKLVTTTALASHLGADNIAKDINLGVISITVNVRLEMEQSQC
jgi:hypothetical protein